MRTEKHKVQNTVFKFVLFAACLAANCAEARSCVELPSGRIVCSGPARGFRDYHFVSRFHYENEFFAWRRSFEPPGVILGYGLEVGCPPRQARVSNYGTGECRGYGAEP
jgi:hypothetical protein